MALQSFVFRGKDYHIVTRNKVHEPAYRKKLTERLNSKYGYSIGKQNVLSALEDSFDFYVQEMNDFIDTIDDLSFYFFVYNLHEQTAELSYYNQDSFQLPVDRQYFAAYRRILKMILQSSCSTNFKIGRIANKKWMMETVAKIEILIYLGEGILGKVDAIAEEKITEGSIQITFKEGLVLFSNSKDWKEFLPLFHQDFPQQNSNSVIDSDIQDIFNKILGKEFGIDLKDISHLFQRFEETLYNQTPPRFCTMKEFREIFYRHSSSPHIEDFINGLVLTAQNVASLKSSAYSAYKGDRIIHKPVLSINLDGTNCILCGYFSFHEAINTLFQNNITLGKVPKEWNDIHFMKKLEQDFSARHKDTLENPVEQLLKDNQIDYDRNVITLYAPIKKNNLSINKKPGEIDFIFLLNDTIYIADCKNLTKRYEMHGYYQDISKFLPYNKKMEEKLIFFRDNFDRLEEHLQVVLKKPDLDLKSHKIEGIYIINTPTLSMYNGAFKTYSFHNFELLLHEEDVFEKIVYLNDENNTEIKWPYIDSYKEHLKTRDST